MSQTNDGYAAMVSKYPCVSLTRIVIFVLLLLYLFH